MEMKTNYTLLDYGTLAKLTSPTQRGKKRLAGIDFNKKRNILIMECILALAFKPSGFSVSDVVEQMKRRMSKQQAKNYNSRQARYDLGKFLGKDLIEKITKKRKYKANPKGIQTIVSVLVMTQKTLPSVLSAINKETLSESPDEQNKIDAFIINIRNDIKALYQEYGIKVVA